MAAQILPFIDGAQDALESQRLSIQQSAESRQNAEFAGQQQLRQLQIDSERAAAPIRQQLLQQELDTSKQAYTQSAQNFAQRSAMAPGDLTLQQQQITGNDQKLQQSKYQSAQDIINDTLTNEHQRITNKLGTQALDQNAEKMIMDKAANNLGIALRPQTERALLLKPLVDHGVMDPQTAQQILNAPDVSKSLEDEMLATLGPIQTANFKHYDKLSQQQDSKDDVAFSMDPKNPRPLPSTQNWQKAMDILGQYMNSRQKVYGDIPTIDPRKDSPDILKTLKSGDVRNVVNPKTGQTHLARWDGKQFVADVNVKDLHGGLNKGQ